MQRHSPRRQKSSERLRCSYSTTLTFDLGECIGGKNNGKAQVYKLERHVFAIGRRHLVYSMTAFAQSAKDTYEPNFVIPLTGKEPPAKIVTYPPLAEPLASRGVAIIQYCTQKALVAADWPCVKWAGLW